MFIYENWAGMTQEWSRIFKKSFWSRKQPRKNHFYMCVLIVIDVCWFSYKKKYVVYGYWRGVTQNWSRICLKTISCLGFVFLASAGFICFVDKTSFLEFWNMLNLKKLHCCSYLVKFPTYWCPSTAKCKKCNYFSISRGGFDGRCHQVLKLQYKCFPANADRAATAP